VKPVILHLVQNPEIDHGTGGNADGQTSDVNQGMNFVPKEFPKSNFQSVEKHEFSPDNLEIKFKKVCLLICHLQ
jgi:hypothetical protein